MPGRKKIISANQRSTMILTIFSPAKNYIIMPSSTLGNNFITVTLQKSVSCDSIKFYLANLIQGNALSLKNTYIK
jgi:hypothetical protein